MKKKCRTYARAASPNNNEIHTFSGEERKSSLQKVPRTFNKIKWQKGNRINEIRDGIEIVDLPARTNSKCDG